jgi:hypothetical protein
MSAMTTDAKVLVGPRRLNDRICRLMYVRETDEAWTEEWADRSWRRTVVLVREVLSAPVASESVLRRRGIPAERGEWDREAAVA